MSMVAATHQITSSSGSSGGEEYPGVFLTLVAASAGRHEEHFGTLDSSYAFGESTLQSLNGVSLSLLEIKDTYTYSDLKENSPIILDLQSQATTKPIQDGQYSLFTLSLSGASEDERTQGWFVQKELIYQGFRMSDLATESFNTLSELLDGSFDYCYISPWSLTVDVAEGEVLTPIGTKSVNLNDQISSNSGWIGLSDSVPLFLFEVTFP